MRCPSGREVTVSLQNLSPRAQEDTEDDEPDCPLPPVHNKKVSNYDCDLPIEWNEVAPQSVEDRETRELLLTWSLGVHQELIKAFPTTLWRRQRVVFIFLKEWLNCVINTFCA